MGFQIVTNIYATIAVLAFCCMWLRTVVRRFPADLCEVRESKDDAARAAIVAIWILSVLMVIWLGGATFSRITSIIA